MRDGTAGDRRLESASMPGGFFESHEEVLEMRSRGGWWALGTLAALAVGATIGRQRTGAQPPAGGPAAGAQAPATSPVPPLGPNGLGLTYRPMPSWFRFRPKGEIDGWVRQNNVGAMIEHAWELWGGLTSEITGNVGGQPMKFPTFETWVDEFTVFPQPSRLAAASSLSTETAATPHEPAHRFTRPKQLLRRRAAAHTRARAAAPTPEVPRVVTVKYTREIYDNVWANGYNQTAVMKALNDSWGTTKLADRKVHDFDDKSIMLKPTYQIVSGSEATLVNYWAGPAASSNPSAPGFESWTNKMLVVPPGVATAQAVGVPAVPVDQFYHFRLNAREADFINGLNQGTFKAGDYAILVAMHVSSREIDNWTWQTFWWSIDKPHIPESVRDRVPAPFDHYDVAVGYSFTTGPDSVSGLNVVCFNPYLEADFDNSTFASPGQLGIESNCMSCHRAAAWPPPNFPSQPNAAYFTANGILRPDDPYFQGTTKVDFLWGFADDVAPPPPPSQGNGN
jgi:hypothetical protein